MYVPGHFAMRDVSDGSDGGDPTELRALIAAHPLATLITHDADGGLDANHVPLFLDTSRGPHGTLVGHVARANPVWRTPGPALAVFHGPDAYISPNWYPSKQADGGRVVPTWNYSVVHAHGALGVVTDLGTLLGIVTRLTNANEARTSRVTGDHAWHVDDAPDDYVGRMLGAIVGIEIPVDRLIGKAKLSQNRSAADREGAAAGLQAAGSPMAVAPVSESAAG